MGQLLTEVTREVSRALGTAWSRAQHHRPNLVFLECPPPDQAAEENLASAADWTAWGLGGLSGLSVAEIPESSHKSPHIVFLLSLLPPSLSLSSLFPFPLNKFECFSSL